MVAQILAAAAASVSGPATSRNCMPSPLLPSLITMIGCSAASGAFDRDLSRPRHSARKPPTELAPPTSTPNSVRLTASWDEACGVVGAAAVFSGAGLSAAGFSLAAFSIAVLSVAVLSSAALSMAGVVAALSGEVAGVASAVCGAVVDAVAAAVVVEEAVGDGVLAGSGSISLEAAGSGGPIIDLAATSGIAAVVAGGLDEAGAAGGNAGSGVGAAAAIFALACSRRLASAACFPVTTADVVATGPIIKGAVSVAAASGAGAGVAPSTTGGADAAGAAEAGAGVAGAADAFCLAIAPVTESSPCSRVDKREYIRSRSPFSVSIADASRLVSFWLSRAADWICCAWRDKSAAASSSWRNRSDDWF